MTIRNTIAAWGWLICSAFLLGCAVMSWSLLNNGIPEGTSPFLAIGFNLLSWIIGGFGSVRMFSKPITVLHASTDGITTESIWVWKKRCLRYEKSSILAIKVNETKDSEGDPYFETIVAFNDGLEITVTEGHFRDRCVLVAEALNKALGIS